jgi:hypothetical protein
VNQRFVLRCDRTAEFERELGEDIDFPIRAQYEIASLYPGTVTASDAHPEVKVLYLQRLLALKTVHDGQPKINATGKGFPTSSTVFKDVKDRILPALKHIRHQISTSLELEAEINEKKQELDILKAQLGTFIHC